MGRAQQKDTLLIWLGAVRMGKGLTQQQVADKIEGLSVRTLQRWESGEGNPRLDQLRAIMKLYGLSGLDTVAGELKYRPVLPEDVRAALSQLPEKYRRPLIELITTILEDTHRNGG